MCVYIYIYIHIHVPRDKYNETLGYLINRCGINCEDKANKARQRVEPQRLLSGGESESEERCPALSINLSDFGLSH